MQHSLALPPFWQDWRHVLPRHSHHQSISRIEEMEGETIRRKEREREIVLSIPWGGGKGGRLRLTDRFHSRQDSYSFFLLASSWWWWRLAPPFILALPGRKLYILRSKFSFSGAVGSAWGWSSSSSSRSKCGKLISWNWEHRSRCRGGGAASSKGCSRS